MSNLNRGKKSVFLYSFFVDATGRAWHIFNLKKKGN